MRANLHETYVTREKCFYFAGAISSFLSGVNANPGNRKMGFRIFRRNMKLFLLSPTGRRRAPGDAQVFEGYGGRDLAQWQPYPRVVLRLQRLGQKLQHPRRLFQILPGLQGRRRRKSCGRTGTG